MLAKAMNKGLRSKLGYISSNTLLQHKIQLFCILGTARYFKMLDTSQTLKLVSRPTSYTQCNNICFICNNSVQCMLLNVIVFNIILFFFFLLEVVLFGNRKSIQVLIMLPFFHLFIFVYIKITYILKHE